MVYKKEDITASMETWINYVFTMLGHYEEYGKCEINMDLVLWFLC
jgi:hypothetical protein